MLSTKKKMSTDTVARTLVVLGKMEKIHITHFFIASFLAAEEKELSSPKQKHKQTNKNPF